MSPPVTSVTMPAHNAAETIREALESALAQSVSDIEIVVVDDGSKDGTAEVVESIGDERVRLIRMENNVGVSRARNTAVAAARAPLISVLDADDMWDPNYLERVLPALEDPAVGLAYANCRYVRSAGQPEYLPHMSDVDRGVTEPWRHPIDRFPELTEACPVPALTTTMRTQAVRDVGGYATWLRCGSDWQLHLQLVKAGWRFAYVDEVLATYRWPEPGRGLSFDLNSRELSDLKIWTRFALRYPLTPGVWPRVAHDLRRVAVRRAPFLKTVKRGVVQARGRIAA
jgi:glycosyltransferase involved in cell wall biosynthesis